MKNIGLKITKGKPVYGALTETVSVGLQSFTEAVLSTTVVATANVVYVANLQAYDQGILAPTINVVAHRVTEVNLLTYTESLLETTVFAQGPSMSTTATPAVLSLTEMVLGVAFAGQPMVITVNTNNLTTGSSSGNQFRLPLMSGQSYNFTVDWGDGQSDLITASNDSLLTHTYASGGIYTVKMKGILPQLGFNNEGERVKLTGIVAWGGQDFAATQNRSFWGCSNLTSLPSHTPTSLNNITNGNQMFESSGITSLPASMTFPNLQIGYRMFYLSGLTGNALPAGMTLANLWDGYFMFASTSITTLPTGITLPLLSSAQSMFLGCNFPIERYSQLLQDMANNNALNNVNFHGGNSRYNAAGKTARDTLVGIPRNWAITDGGYFLIIRPTSDMVVGNWSVAPLWSKVNDQNNNTSIISTQTTSPCVMAFPTLGANANGASTLTVVASKPTGGSDPSLTIDFRQSTTVLHTVTVAVIEGINTYTLSVPTILSSGVVYNVQLGSSTGGKPADRRESIVHEVSLTVPQP